MQLIIHKTEQDLWLSLLVVFVLCAGLTSPISWAEDLQQEIELVSKEVADSSDDDRMTTGFIPWQTANERLSYPPDLHEGRLAISDSDAYSSLILHGPPTPN